MKHYLSRMQEPHRKTPDTAFPFMMSYSSNQNSTEVTNDPAHHVRWIHGGSQRNDLHRGTADSQAAHAKVKRRTEARLRYPGPSGYGGRSGGRGASFFGFS